VSDHLGRLGHHLKYGRLMSAPDIDAEDESTWPPELIARMEGAQPALCDYEVERRRIDRLAETNVSFRINPPSNPHENARTSVLDAANALLRDRSLVAFHCTRLTSDEVASIQQNGFDPLSVDLVTRRVSARVAAGDLTEELGKHLLEKTRARESNRTGLLWVIFTKTTLKDESGVYRFFDYWGGEALYMPHEQNNHVAPILKKLGRPAIVEVSVRVSDMPGYPPVGERLLSGFLHRRGIETENDFEFEDNIKVRLAGTQIRRVLTDADDDFFTLTGRKRPKGAKTRTADTTRTPSRGPRRTRPR
jgi:hypothetical protein